MEDAEVQANGRIGSLNFNCASGADLFRHMAVETFRALRVWIC